MEFKILISPNGSQYEDYWVNNEQCGKGRILFVNGEIHQRDWTDDKAHGWIKRIKSIKLRIN